MRHHDDLVDDAVRRLPLVTDEQVLTLADGATEQALFQQITNGSGDVPPAGAVASRSPTSGGHSSPASSRIPA